MNAIRKMTVTLFVLILVIFGFGNVFSSDKTGIWEKDRIVISKEIHLNNQDQTVDLQNVTNRLSEEKVLSQLVETYLSNVYNKNPAACTNFFLDTPSPTVGISGDMQDCQDAWYRDSVGFLKDCSYAGKFSVMGIRVSLLGKDLSSVYAECLLADIKVVAKYALVMKRMDGQWKIVTQVYETDFAE